MKSSWRDGTFIYKRGIVIVGYNKKNNRTRRSTFFAIIKFDEIIDSPTMN